MNARFVATLGVAALIALTPRADTIAAIDGVVEIEPIAHASVELTYGKLVVFVDPWSRLKLNYAKQADVIIVTDDPEHHLDPVAINKLRKAGTVVIVPPSSRAKYPESTPLAGGSSITVGDIKVDAVLAYDLTPGEPFHPKGKGNGYVVTLGGKRVFFAGVTECVSEIEALRDIDVAFVPMNLPANRMTPSATASCVRTFKPKVVYPYHYDQEWAARQGGARTASPNAARVTAINDSLSTLRELLRGSGIEVRVADWYPQP